MSPAGGPLPAYSLAAPALSYDDLPEGSDLKREWVEGALKIVAPAGEPSTAERRRVAQQTMVRSVTPCTIGAALALFVFGVLLRADRLDTGLRITAAVLFGVLCLGVFLLVWGAIYGGRIEHMIECRRHPTVLFANGSRLLVEAAGRGAGSYLLVADRIRSFAVTLEQSEWGWSNAVDVLEVRLIDAPPVHLLAGRDRRELYWVAQGLGRVLDKPVKPLPSGLRRLLISAGWV